MGKGWFFPAVGAPGRGLVLFLALFAAVLWSDQAARAGAEAPAAVREAAVKREVEPAVPAGGGVEIAAGLEGEVAAVEEGSLLLWTPVGERRLALAPGAAVALNGVPVAAAALRPVTERDWVEVRVFTDRAGRAVRVDGFYRVEEMQLLAWDLGRRLVWVAPLESSPLRQGVSSALRPRVHSLSGQAQIEQGTHTLSWTELSGTGVAAGIPVLVSWKRSGEIKKIVLPESGALEDLWGTGTNNTGDKLEKEERGGRAEDAGR